MNLLRLLLRTIFNLIKELESSVSDIHYKIQEIESLSEFLNLNKSLQHNEIKSMIEKYKDVMEKCQKDTDFVNNDLELRCDCAQKISHFSDFVDIYSHKNLSNESETSDYKDDTKFRNFLAGDFFLRKNDFKKIRNDFEKVGRKIESVIDYIKKADPENENYSSLLYFFRKTYLHVHLEFHGFNYIHQFGIDGNLSIKQRENIRNNSAGNNQLNEFMSSLSAIVKKISDKYVLIEDQNEKIVKSKNDKKFDERITKEYSKIIEILLLVQNIKIDFWVQQLVWCYNLRRLFNQTSDQNNINWKIDYSIYICMVRLFDYLGFQVLIPKTLEVDNQNYGYVDIDDNYLKDFVNSKVDKAFEPSVSFYNQVFKGSLTYLSGSVVNQIISRKYFPLKEVEKVYYKIKNFKEYYFNPIVNIRETKESSGSLFISSLEIISHKLYQKVFELRSSKKLDKYIKGEGKIENPINIESELIELNSLFNKNLSEKKVFKTDDNKVIKVINELVYVFEILCNKKTYKLLENKNFNEYSKDIPEDIKKNFSDINLVLRSIVGSLGDLLKDNCIYSSIFFNKRTLNIFFGKDQNLSRTEREIRKKDIGVVEREIIELEELIVNRRLNSLKVSEVDQDNQTKHKEKSTNLDNEEKTNLSKLSEKKNKLKELLQSEVYDKEYYKHILLFYEKIIQGLKRNKSKADLSYLFYKLEIIAKLNIENDKFYGRIETSEQTLSEIKIDGKEVPLNLKSTNVVDHKKSNVIKNLIIRVSTLTR